MPKSIRVRILGREYPLKVQDENEAVTREMAAYVNDRIQAFRHAHPEQSDLVAAVVTALALAGDLFNAWAASEQTLHTLDDELSALDQRLAEALLDGSAPAASNGNLEAANETEQ
jgi:cell division protein ZapA